jgi:hypothetical protein
MNGITPMLSYHGEEKRRNREHLKHPPRELERIMSALVGFGSGVLVGMMGVLIWQYLNGMGCPIIPPPL